jgi:hypothetical protein
MDTIPTPTEADQALRQIRHQQAETIRRAYTRDPWWMYLALVGFFVGYGLGRDLASGWAALSQIVSWVILLGAVLVQRRRRKIRPSVASAWRMNGPVLWVVTTGYAVAMVALLFGAPLVLASLGVPFPHTIGGLATGLAVAVAAIPLGRWSLRRAVARAESRTL